MRDWNTLWWREFRKKDYLTQQVTLSDSPFDWVAVTGRRRGNYFLLKYGHFHIKQGRPQDEDLSLDTVEKAGPLQPTASEASHDSDAKSGLRAGTVAISSDFAGFRNLHRREICGADSFDDRP